MTLFGFKLDSCTQVRANAILGNNHGWQQLHPHPHPPHTLLTPTPPWPQVEGAQQLCPPGLTFQDCPAHFDCYVPCDASEALTWIPVDGSPYGGMAYCEAFPRGLDSNSDSNSTLDSNPGSNSTLDPNTDSNSTLDSNLDSNSTLDSNVTSYWAQVGKAQTFEPNYDNIFYALISIFVILTQVKHLFVSCL